MFSFFHFDIDFKLILSLIVLHNKRRLKSRAATAKLPLSRVFSSLHVDKTLPPAKAPSCVCGCYTTSWILPQKHKTKTKLWKVSLIIFLANPEGGDQPFKSLHLSTELRSVRLLSRYPRSPIVCKSLRQLSEKENIMKSSPGSVDMIPAWFVERRGEKQKVRSSDP